MGARERSIFSYFVKCHHALLLLVLAAVAEGHAVAQSISDEILVTARRYAERLQDAPLAVTLFSQTDTVARSSDSLAGIAEFAPNVSFDSTSPLSGSSNAASIFIRGVGQTDFAITTDPGVGVYVDGIYLARATGADLDLLDIERVEILRGPQGTLFGRNAIGGAITVTTHTPQIGQLEAKAEAIVGRFDRFDLRAAFNLPVTPVLAIRVAGARQRRDGFGRRLLTGQGMGGQHRDQVRVSGLWAPDPTFEARATVDYAGADEQSPVQTTAFTSRVGSVTAPGTLFTGLLYNNLIGAPAPCQTPSFVVPFCGIPGLIALPALPADTPGYDGRWLTGNLLTSNATGPTGSRSEIIGVNSAISWRPGRLHLKATTAYRASNFSFGRDPDGSPLTLVHTSNAIRHRQFSQELELAGGDSKSLRWLIGSYYLSEHARERLLVPFAQETFDVINGFGLGCTLLPGLTGAPGPIALNPCPNPFFIDVAGAGASIRNRSLAAFAEATVGLATGLSLTTGVRWTRDVKQVDLSGYFIGGMPFSARPQARDRFTRITPRAILDYKPLPDLLIYGSFATGYKSGGFNERYGAPLADGPTTFAPESVRSFEIGMKTTLLGGRVQINLAAFRSTYDDIQVVVFDNTIPRTINAARGRVGGAELESSITPAKGIILQLSYGYLDARYTRLDPAVIGSFGVPIVNPLRLDYAFVNSPRHTLSAGAEYARDIGVGTLWMRADLSYRSKTANDAINTPELTQSSLFLLRARAGFTTLDKRWSFTLFGTNLTDKRYVVSGAADEVGFARAELNAGRPREWGVSVSAKY